MRRILYEPGQLRVLADLPRRRRKRILRRTGSPSLPLATGLQIIESREQGVNGLVD